MTRTLLTGATGRLGRELRPRLVAAGHDVRAASRSPPRNGDDDIEWVELDLTDGTGLPVAVEGADVIVHAASAPTGDTEAVDVDGTERLLDAAADAGVSNVLYVSIVGIEEIPYSYYEHKLTAERLVTESDVSETIVRATQFHSFLDEILGYVAKLPVWPLPTALQFQPVDAGEVADELVAYATPEPHGRTSPVCGPEVHTLGELAREYREHRGLRRPVVRVPIPGGVAGGFRDGYATCPDHAVGTVTWADWLDRRYGQTPDATGTASGSPS